MPADKTIDTVLMIIAGGLLAMGLSSLLIGWMLRQWDRFVSRFQHVMSRESAQAEKDEPVRERFEPAEPPAVRGQQNQIEPAEPGQIEPAGEPARLYRLSRQEEIVILAIQRDASGAYRHSANEITKFMGGTAADVKEQIRAVRDPKPEAEPPAQSIKRPADGWAR